MLKHIAGIFFIVSFWGLFFSGTAATACDCEGDPGHALFVPERVEIGTSFEICAEAPPRSLVILLASSGDGPIDTSVGTLCLDYPFLAIVSFVMPQAGSICFRHYLYCDPELAGVTGYLQFVALSGGVSGRSNMASLTAADGLCGDVFCGFTQGGWGQECHGNNVGCRRDEHFAHVFPAGLVLGDQDGADGDEPFSLRLTSAEAVENFLPQGGTAGTLDSDLVDPEVSSAGVFAGQLAAAKLNVAFDDAGLFDEDRGEVDTRLGDIVFVDCVDSDLWGLTVREVIAIADRVISGEFGACLGDDEGCQGEDRFDVDGDGSPDVSISDLSEALDELNNNFGECGTSRGCFGLGEPE
ncbi:MAG: hypothetical protein AB1486_18965 [Planctomycetota bacterium]